MPITLKLTSPPLMSIMQPTVMFIMYIRPFIRPSIENTDNTKNIDNQQAEKGHEHKSIKDSPVYVRQQS